MVAKRACCGKISLALKAAAKCALEVARGGKGEAAVWFGTEASEDKYRALALFAKFSGDNLEASIKMVRNFREVEKVSELIGLLR